MTEKLTIQKIRELIADLSVRFVNECSINRLRINQIISTFPGSGKTTSVMEAIDKAGYTWMYFAPFHDVIQENLHFFLELFVVFC